MDYGLLKNFHVGAVVISGLGFVARGMGSLSGASWVHGRVAKILPHLVDTLLLASALMLAISLGLNPARTPWLLAKIVGLLLYITLGLVALRPRFSRALRATCWAFALVVLAWIASVATLKNPLGFVSCLVQN